MCSQDSVKKVSRVKNMESILKKSITEEGIVYEGNFSRFPLRSFFMILWNPCSSLILSAVLIKHDTD